MTSIPKGRTDNLILYAAWTPIQYTLNLSTSDGEYLDPITYNVETPTFDLPVITKNGHDFVGWYDNDKFEGDPITQITIGSFGDKTLYAKWQFGVKLKLEYDSYLQGSFVLGLEDSETTELIIPANYNGQKIIGIYYGAFKDNTNLRKVVIETGITEIRSEAFYGCTSLVEISLPNTLNKIGTSAFSSCTSLESIVIPQSVTILNSKVLKGCTSLKSATINANLESVKDIEDDLLAECENLEDLNISSIFTQGTSLSWIAYYSSEFPQKLFNTVGTLTYLKLNGNPYFGLYRCSASTSTEGAPIYVTLNDKCTVIYNKAFYACFLDKVTVPASVKIVGSSAFESCSGFRRDSKNNSYIETFNVEFKGIELLGNGAFNKSSVTKVLLPDTLVKLAGGCFYNCKKLTSITIPKSVESIGEEVFGYCENLSSVTFKCLTPKLFEGIFRGCKNLTSITLPEGMEVVGDKMFIQCNNLVHVNLPSTLKKIGNGAFTKCSSLNNINLPDGLTEISSEAFSECSSLTSIDIPSSVTYLSSGAFYACTSLKTVNLHTSSLKKICTRTFSKSGITQIIISEGVTEIEEGAFAYCNDLTTVLLPQSLEIIDRDAFIECESLVNITIPSNLRILGPSAFYRCYSLTSVTIPENVQYIYTDTFTDCTSLVTLVIIGHKEELKTRAFANCFALQHIYLPESAHYWRSELFAVTDNPNYAQMAPRTLVIHYAGTQEKWKKIASLPGWQKYIGEYTVEFESLPNQTQ